MLAGNVKATGVRTSTGSMIDYASYAENAYLLFRNRNYISKFAETESTPQTGIIRITWFWTLYYYLETLSGRIPDKSRCGRLMVTLTKEQETDHGTYLFYQVWGIIVERGRQDLRIN